MSLALLSSAHGPLSAKEFPDFATYSQASFDKAQKDGKLVAVNFHASWCGNCKNQAYQLGEIMKETDEFKDLIILHADFDDTKDLQKKMGVKKRTQILLFKNNKEVGRIKKGTKDAILKKLRAASSS